MMMRAEGIMPLPTRMTPLGRGLLFLLHFVLDSGKKMFLRITERIFQCRVSEERYSERRELQDKALVNGGLEPLFLFFFFLSLLFSSVCSPLSGIINAISLTIEKKRERDKELANGRERHHYN